MATLSPIRVLLVNVGGPGAPGTIRSLSSQKERDVVLVGIDTNPNCASRALLDAFKIAPRSDAAEFIPFVENLCKEEKIDVILPLSSIGIELFRAFADTHESPKVVISSDFSLKKALNKRLLFEFLAQEGFEELIPEYRSATTPDEFKKALTTLGFPEKTICLKPEEGKGGRGFRVLSNGPALFTDILTVKDGSATPVDATTLFAHPETPRSFSPVLVMEYMPGKEYSVDVLATKGTPLLAVSRTRDVIQSGIAAAGVVEDEPTLRDAAMRITQALQGDYLLNVQFRLDAKGKPKLLEVNPRISGTIAHATCAGVNFPYLAVKQALGESFEIPAPIWGTRLARGFFESYATSDDSWKLL